MPSLTRDGPARTTHRTDPSDVHESPSETAAGRLASRLLSGPLTVGLLVLAAIQVATWLPHYLTWPHWADHDAFAHAARAWTRGALPYRDTPGNNFPGTIYLFLALGQTFGWGRPALVHGLDASLLLTLGSALLAWSRRRFGSLLPGTLGTLGLLAVVLGLDYSHAAQRDGQGPALAILAILLVQGWPGRPARLAAGLLAAAAIAVRPQTALLLPALGLALGEPDQTPSTTRASRLAWCLGAFVVGMVVAFLPLVVAGVFGDFVRGVRLTAYGGAYNRVTVGSFAKGWLLQAAAWRWWVALGGAGLLGWPFDRRATRTAVPWLGAMAGASLYKPLSPVAHSYLDQPLALVVAVMAGVLAGLVLETRGRPELRLAAVLLTLGLSATTLRPEFCVVGPTVGAWTRGVGGLPDEPPPGYRKGTVPTSAYYDWHDYRRLIEHLKATTAPETPLANLLRGDPALVSMVDRPSALPTESVAWLRMVRPEDEPRFARQLAASRNAVVVWIPGEAGPDPSFETPLLTAVVARDFRFDTRIGPFEVWRRSDAP